ncbi:sideroflexin-2 [Adelges cooleyi]|uniref:sideroflexin-2 n=1 Tax=Adelges cooleyi TaxID=133065 RepID=UPI00217FE17C|nr:sideroflexin-2 [Adelges cooleyi]XP_050420591.1 sideroflexin-2 [Adelges cooleyi]XP_050420592.1 sideroflexin-2 [Adelges cooleyi]XP_050420593.1 sideroflexin-2 [Adelges cooleyi]XP_050420594.1 sideroflexin-2 [Adelges cooleyi]XP_050420595.1 sideroflexin-2 [Adelges cooleyi]XP_050420596.1 sideroflexin-2 [Adelges cooleyi]XP_050420597.1 sideroflexin-2 [Adelges cooleyi]
MELNKFDFEKCPWDQNTFSGRWNYYFWITNPMLCLKTDKELEEAKALRFSYLSGTVPTGTTDEQLLAAKRIYESSFHPDTAQKQNVFGRMGFQVPGGMAITGAMLSFYKTVPAIVFWQWINQSFNALVNYTNRNANSPLSQNQMGVAYVSATVAACITSIQFKQYLTRNTTPFFQRYVPFAAVAAANFVNIPLMRQNELLTGVDVFDADKNRVGCSKLAAAKGISQVILSRIVMCAPGMVLLPVIMEKLESKSAWFKRSTWIHAPFQTLAVGCFLVGMVPTACALFPQFCPIKLSTLEKYENAAYCDIVNNCKNPPAVVYSNKGL